MGISSDSKRWDDKAKHAGELIIASARLQQQQARIAEPLDEARRVWALYKVGSKKQAWTEFGDVAFHFAAAYPPDLGYFLIYAMRGSGYQRRSGAAHHGRVGEVVLPARGSDWRNVGQYSGGQIAPRPGRDRRTGWRSWLGRSAGRRTCMLAASTAILMEEQNLIWRQR